MNDFHKYANWPKNTGTSYLNNEINYIITFFKAENDSFDKHDSSMLDYAAADFTEYTGLRLASRPRHPSMIR